MNKKILFIICGWMSIFFSSYLQMDVCAKENASNLIENFSYEVIFPENQQKKEVGYYDLLMKPDAKQTVKLKLNNTSNQLMKIEICLNSAKTNGSGVIEYGPNKIKKDASLKYELSKLMAGPKEVTLSPKSSEVISFMITLPPNAFEGYIVGGIQLKLADDEEEEIVGGNIILNKFAFLIGVLIHESDASKISPNLELNKVYVKLNEGIHSLFVNISNTQGIFIENMSIDIKIREKNKQKIFLAYKKEHMRMAPNTMIDIPVSLDNKKIMSGEYTTDIQIKTEAGESWQWIKNFTFTNIEAKQINQQILEEAPKFNYWLIVSFLFLLFCFGAIIFTLKKVKKK